MVQKIREARNLCAKKGVGHYALLLALFAFLLSGGMLCSTFAKASMAVKADPVELKKDLYYDATDLEQDGTMEGTTKTVQPDALTILAQDGDVKQPKTPAEGGNPSGEDLYETKKADPDVWAAAEVQFTPEEGITITEISNIKWSAYIEAKAPDFEDKDIITAENDAGAKGWDYFVSADVTEETSVTAKVLITKADITCTIKYKDGEETPQERDGVTLTNVEFNPSDTDTSYKPEAIFSLKLKNAQVEDETNIAEMLKTPFSGVYWTTQKLDPISLVGKQYSISPEESDAVKVNAEEENNILNMSFKPLDVFDSMKTVTIGFYAPSNEDKPLISVVLKVSKATSKHVKYVGETSLDWFVQSKQNENLESKLNNSANWEASGTNDDEVFNPADLPEDSEGNKIIVEDDVNVQYEDVPDVYPTNDFKANISYKFNSQIPEGKYIEDNPKTEVNVKVGAPLDVTTLRGFSLTNEDGSQSINLGVPQDQLQWVNWDTCYATFNSFKLSTDWKNEGEFTGKHVMDNTQGGHYNIRMFAEDSNGVIKYIDSIAYKLDRTAPKVTSFSVSDPTADWTSLWVFDKKANVKILASDTVEGREVAGIDFSSPENKAEYYDKHGQAEVYENNFSEIDSNTGIFDFDITDDSQVSPDSFKAYIKDNAGNVSDGDTSEAKHIPQDVLDLAIQSNVPIITIAYDNNDVHNGSYYTQNRTATITISMSTFNYLQQYDGDQEIVKFYTGNRCNDFNGEKYTTFTAKDFKSIGNDQWQVTYSFTQEGDYKVEASLTDLLGRTVTPSQGTGVFTIDKTKPELQVSWDNDNVQNGKYFGASRTATITVNEHNFNTQFMSVVPKSTEINGVLAATPVPSEWKSDGDIHTCTVTFPGDGEYSLSVSGKDYADHVMNPFNYSDFVVATKEPEIHIAVNGEANAASRAYKDSAPLSISMSDMVLSPSSTIDVKPIGLNASANPYLSAPVTTATSMEYTCESPQKVSENDNVYRAVVTATNLAGKTKTETVDWSVNRFGSVYQVDAATQEMLNKQYVKGDDACDVRIIEINPSGINENNSTVTLSAGTNVTPLEKGNGFTLERTNENNWPAYTYTIPKSNFASDGPYKIIVSSDDLAGNSSVNTMENKSQDRKQRAEVSFSIDNTAPIVSFGGFDEAFVPDATHDVTVSVQDNIKFDHAVVKLNDEEIDTIPDSAEGQKQTYTLRQNNEEQFLTVEAYDAAGNVKDQSSNHILVTSDPVAAWLHNPVAVAVTSVCAGGAGVGAVFGIRHLLRARKLKG